MYHIDKNNNAIEPLKKSKFKDLGFNETQNLQEWIAKHPKCLGEDLLIIQKKFSGFTGTREQLDLLALDKDGRLVLIENKLDDSGKDVMWQALKYVSYCEKLKPMDICTIYHGYLNDEGQYISKEEVTERVENFIEADSLDEKPVNSSASQRIILVAANFRKEVTSAVLWLMKFNIQIQCFKVTPWVMKDEPYLYIEQIIPAPSIQDFEVEFVEADWYKKVGDTTEIHVSESPGDWRALRKMFWTELLAFMKSKTTLFAKKSPSNEHWMAISSGLKNVNFGFVVKQKSVRVEVYIRQDDCDDNKFVFDQLKLQQQQLQDAVTYVLVWERLNEKCASRVKVEINASLFEQSNWEQTFEFMTDAMIKFEKVFRDPLKKLGPDLPSIRQGNP